MHLTDFQKVLCLKIRDRKIYDPKSFLFDTKIILPCENASLYTLVVDNSTNNDNSAWDWNPSIIHRQQHLEDFIALLYILERNGLIITKLNFRDTLLHMYTPKDQLRQITHLPDPIDKLYAIYDQIIAFIKSYTNLFSFNGFIGKSFFPTPLLNSYIENDFKTDKELEIEAQKDAYEKQREHNKKTFWISITALILSFLTTVGSNIFTYCTYTKERKVEIINLDSALIKVSRSPLYRGGAQDSLSKIPSPSAVVARDGKNTGK